MAPVATQAPSAPVPTQVETLKQDAQFNPFYSPSIGDDGDETYKFKQYKVRPLRLAIAVQRLMYICGRCSRTFLSCRGRRWKRSR